MYVWGSTSIFQRHVRLSLSGLLQEMHESAEYFGQDKYRVSRIA
jgi:hypothetical protein